MPNGTTLRVADHPDKVNFPEADIWPGAEGVHLRVKRPKRRCTKGRLRNADVNRFARPRIISNNGPQSITKDFKEFIRISGKTNVLTLPFSPIEREDQGLAQIVQMGVHPDGNAIRGQ